MFAPAQFGNGNYSDGYGLSIDMVAAPWSGSLAGGYRCFLKNVAIFQASIAFQGKSAIV